MIVFAEALIGSPASYFMAGIVALWAALIPFGKRTLEMGSFALAGVIMYVVSTAIITSYHHVDGNIQVTWWTASLLVVRLLYIAVLIARGVRTQIPALMAAWVIVAFGGAMASDSDLMRRLFWVFQYAGIGTLAFMCFLALDEDDLLGHLVWGILFIAEGIGAFQVVDCQFLHGLANQPVVEGSACAQVYNWSFAPHLPTALPTLILAWILFRWFRPRLR